MKSTFASALAILAGTLFGAAGVFVRPLTAGGLDNITIVFMRTFFAVIMLFIYILITDRTLLKIKLKDFWVIACAGLVGTMMTAIAINISTVELTLSLAAILSALFPVFVLIMSRIVFGEKITKKKIICMIAAFAGAFLATDIIGSDIKISFLGIVGGIASAVFYGSYSIFSKIASERGYRSFTIIFYGMLCILVVTAPFNDYGKVIEYVQADPVFNFAVLFGHSLFIAVLSYVFLNMALQHIDAGKCSILASCEPVAAMVCGIIFFNEVPTVLGILGLVITMVACTVLMLDKK